MQLKVLNITRVLLEKNKQKLDIYKTWATPIVKIWIGLSVKERNDCIVKMESSWSHGIENESERKIDERMDTNFNLMGLD